VAVRISRGRPDEPWCYDPPRLLSPEDVASAARFLQTVPFQRLAEHFDPAALTAAEVYPHMWDDDGALEYLAGWYAPLVEFFAGAADQGDSVLIWLA
jgi:hypothetical protein